MAELTAVEELSLDELVAAFKRLYTRAEQRKKQLLAEMNEQLRPQEDELETFVKEIEQRGGRVRFGLNVAGGEIHDVPLVDSPSPDTKSDL